MDASSLVAFWREKSDGEIRIALAELDDYEEEARAIIESEAARRSIVVTSVVGRPASTRGDEGALAANESSTPRGWLVVDVVAFSLLALLALLCAWDPLVALLELVSERKMYALAASPFQVVWTVAMVALVVFALKRIVRSLRRLRLRGNSPA